MLTNVMFDIEKMKLGSFSLFLDPFEIVMSLYTYTTYVKGVLGLGEHFIRVMQKGIVRSCLPENLKLLTLPVLKIWAIMYSQNGHL